MTALAPFRLAALAQPWAAGLLRRAVMHAVVVAALLVAFPERAFADELGPTAPEPGVSATTVRIGALMDLEGSLARVSADLRVGLEAAFDGVDVQGRRIELVVRNDGYEPERAQAAARELVEGGVFAMAASVGTPTAEVTLPILASARVPAVGFFSGASLLRPGPGDVLNFRPSYGQEIESVVLAALDAGVSATGMCAFAQDDAYGMAAVAGLARALNGAPDAGAPVEALRAVAEREAGPARRNFLGPVGVYARNTFAVAEAYASLKAWEARSGERCRLVVSAAANRALASFVGHARRKGEGWVVSAVSFSDARSTAEHLLRFGVRDGVLMTQVVPALDADIAIVQAARAALGPSFGFASLEGYLVGRLVARALRTIEGPISREAFLNAMYGRQLDIDGFRYDFTTDNQASDDVLTTRLDGARGFVPLAAGELRALLNR